MRSSTSVFRSLIAAMAFTAALPGNVSAQLTCSTPGPCSAHGAGCGVERWPVKTGTDPGASLISLVPVANTVANMTSLPAKPGGQNSRTSPTETTVYTINATITGYKLESDSDYFLEISDGSGKTMDVEIPYPGCVAAGSPWTCFITTACGELESKVTPTTTFQTANIPVQVTGVGFFDSAHGEPGQAPNAVEIHPILDLKFTSDFALAAAGRNLHFRLGKPIPVGGCQLY